MSLNRPRGLRDFRRALGAYVLGHDRIWETERKLGREVAGVAEEAPRPEWHGEPPPPRYGVGVPHTLAFHRGPSTWRDGAPARRGASGEDDDGS